MLLARPLERMAHPPGVRFSAAKHRPAPACGRAALVDARVSRVSRPPGDGACPSQMLGMARRDTSGMSFRRDAPGKRQGRHVLDG